MSIGMRIKEARKKRKLTQMALANKAGLSQMSVRRYETDERVPPSDVLGDLATALGVDANYLLYGQPTEASIQQHRDTLPARHQAAKASLQATRDYYKSLGYSFDYRGKDYVITDPDGTQITLDALREMPLYDEMIKNALGEDAELIHQRAIKKVKR